MVSIAAHAAVRGAVEGLVPSVDVAPGAKESPGGQWRGRPIETPLVGFASGYFITRAK